MQRHHRIRLLAVAAVLVIAGSVWVAADRQRSAADLAAYDRVEVPALSSGEDG